MFKKLAAPAVLVLALLLTSACAASDVKQAKFESALKKETKFTDAEASCVTKATYAKLDKKQIQKLYTASDVTDLSKATQDAWTAILKSCVTK